MSAIRKTQLNSVAAAYQVFTILDTVAKLPFYIVLRAVLCKLILSLRCVLSGCTVTSRPFCIQQASLAIKFIAAGTGFPPFVCIKRLAVK